MAHKAPNLPTTVSADRCKSIADMNAQGALDLTAISGMGNFAAQLIRLNNSGAAAASIVMTPEYPSTATNITIVLNPTSQYEVIVPIRALVSCDVATVSALIYWWAGNLSNPFNR